MQARLLRRTKRSVSRETELFFFRSVLARGRSVDVFVREPLDFRAMLSEAVIKDLDGVAIPVASIRHLIRLKQAAGRPLDLDDIQALQMIAAETGQDIT